jgi:hypothetical protein
MEIKIQLNKDLVLWKDKQDWQILIQTNKKKEGEVINY